MSSIAAKAPSRLRGTLNVVLIVLVSVVGTLAVLGFFQVQALTKRNNVAFEERICQRANANCYPAVTKEASAATLAAWEQQLTTWATSLENGDASTSGPGYVDLPLLMDDRLKAEQFSLKVSADIAAKRFSDLNKHIAEARDAHAGPNAILSKDYAPGTGLASILQIIRDCIEGMILPGLVALVANRDASQFLPRSIKKYYGKNMVDMGDGFKGFLRTNTSITRKIFIIFIFVPPILIISEFFTNNFSAAGVIIGRNLATPVWAFGSALELFIWFAKRRGLAKDWNDNYWRMRQTAPKPQARDEHGSARHAADEDLLSKGFAEREDSSSDAAMYAQMAAMSDEELKDMADRMGAEIIRRPNGKFTIRPKGYTG